MNLKNQTRETLAAYGFLGLNLAGFLLFTCVPVLASLVLAFTSYDMLSADSFRFIGLRNFRQLLFNDLNFWKYLYNTFFLMLGIPVSIAGSLGLALLLNQKLLRGRFAYRLIYFLPSMCVPISIYVLWQWIYSPDFGLLNWALRQFVGIQHPPMWLTSSVWAKPALMLVGLWAGIGGFNMILYLAALQGIPRDLYEAAEIDGAGPWARFRSITWPMISPTTFFIMIMSIIGGLQGSFDNAYVMTRGGPAGSTTTMMYQVFQNGFMWMNMGYASAIAWILFVLVFIFTLIAWRTGNRGVHYE